MIQSLQTQGNNDQNAHSAAVCSNIVNDFGEQDICSVTANAETLGRGSSVSGGRTGTVGTE